MRVLIDKETAVSKAKAVAGEPFGAALIVKLLEDMPEVKRSKTHDVKTIDEISEVVIKWLLRNLPPKSDILQNLVHGICGAENFHMRIVSSCDVDIMASENRVKIGWSVDRDKIQQLISREYIK